MATWPNWIDLLIVTIVIRGCYNGFGHGLLAELLNLAGAVCITSLTLNYAETAGGWLGRWGWMTLHVAELVAFWALFAVLTWGIHYVVRRAAEVVKWERLHWLVQGVGLVVGGIRALWWAGFLVVVLAASGFVFLRQSVTERSIFGPRLLGFSREGFARVADVFPGAAGRHEALVPPMKPAAR